MNDLVSQSRLFALLEGYGGFQGLAVAEDGDFHYVADFAAAERVCEIVQIVDGLVAKLNHDVAAEQACLRGRRAGLHICNDALISVMKDENRMSRGRKCQMTGRLAEWRSKKESLP